MLQTLLTYSVSHVRSDWEINAFTVPDSPNIVCHMSEKTESLLFQSRPTYQVVWCQRMASLTLGSAIMVMSLPWRLMQGTVHCSLCTVHCAVCTVQCAVCSVQCAVCSVQCAGLVHWLGLCWVYQSLEPAPVLELHGLAVFVTAWQWYCSLHWSVLIPIHVYPLIASVLSGWLPG